MNQKTESIWFDMATDIVESHKPSKYFYEMDQLEKIMAFEEGNLNDHETIALFQELIDSGLVWNYKKLWKMADYLIKTGFISKEKQTEDK